jgi:hypothetical protein
MSQMSTILLTCYRHNNILDLIHICVTELISIFIKFSHFNFQESTVITKIHHNDITAATCIDPVWFNILIWAEHATWIFVRDFWFVLWR